MDSVTGEAGDKAERAFEFFLGVFPESIRDRAWILETHILPNREDLVSTASTKASAERSIS
jgi:hypothetical protein